MDLVGVRRLGGTAAQCVWCPSCPNPNNHGASAPQRAAARDSELLAEYIDAVQQLTTIVHRGTVDPVEMRRLSEHVQVVRLVRMGLALGSDSTRCRRSWARGPNVAPTRSCVCHPGCSKWMPR